MTTYNGIKQLVARYCDSVFFKRIFFGKKSLLLVVNLIFVI